LNLDQLRQFCLSLPGTTEDFPFDADTLAFRIGGKIYLLSDIQHFASVNLKCDPEKAMELRERHHSVKPGFHMNKKHWNTVEIPGDYTDAMLESWIRHSYDLVKAGLPLSIRQSLSQSGSL
jgi:predicted DNA-binding protein (MmcQ/YjbR family)